MTPDQLKKRRLERDWSAGREERANMLRGMQAQADEHDRKCRESQAAFEDQSRLIDQAMFLVNQAFVDSVMGAFAGIFTEAEIKR